MPSEAEQRLRVSALEARREKQLDAMNRLASRFNRHRDADPTPRWSDLAPSVEVRLASIEAREREVAASVDSIDGGLSACHDNLSVQLRDD